uniref:Sulfate transporter CysZ n=1 Tax=Magnetococcus massalia (strain MO-1) TaxID=451514 RepID=A0A1S7LEK5_MAGMO|nr:conserved membrane protein of unknown function[similar to CysZ Protein] [Candidatus Magnetococcus massalia]
MLGVSYLFKGLPLLTHKRVRPFVLIPLLINIVLFSFGIYYLMGLSEELKVMAADYLPSWLDFLAFIVYPLVLLLALVVLFYGFTIIANILASPFNGMLSERVEEVITGQEPTESDAQSWKRVIAGAPKAIANELGKLLYMVKWLIIGLILLLIPGLNLIAPVLIWLIAAWLLVVEYGDYPTDNNGLTGKQSRKLLGSKRLTSLGFGAAASLMSMIPLINLIAMPTSVAGATILWVEQLKPHWQQQDKG